MRLFHLIAHVDQERITGELPTDKHFANFTSAKSLYPDFRGSWIYKSFFLLHHEMTYQAPVTSTMTRLEMKFKELFDIRTILYNIIETFLIGAISSTCS